MRIFMNDKENLKKVVIEACINGQLTVKQAAIGFISLKDILKS